jgi:hypothetical protein
MKIPLTCAFLIIPYFSCFAEITGYWNFNYSLKATIGENLEWAWEQGDATFGTTDTFAIPGIQGKSANVLEFPDSDEFSAFSGIEVYIGAELDEDEWLFNEYSIIVDILYPETSSTDTRAIVSNAPIEQASVIINGEGKIGGTSFYGEILANNWYRMAIVVSHSSNNINYYLDGEKVGQEAIGGLIDGEGEHSLGDFFYLFTTDELSKGGYISSVQFHNLALPDSVVSDLGGTTKLYEPEDITFPEDEVVPTSDNSPGGEQALNAIDDNPSTKYLNFDKVDTGLTITTGGGVVTGLALTSANDGPDRDPANYILSGSNDDGATFTEIASGDIPEFVERLERQTVSFENDLAYTTYELIFPMTVGPSSCCMQIAEIELLTGAPEAGGDEPGDNEGNHIDGTVLAPFGFRFGFSINTDEGKSYTVEATGDLLQWNKIETFNGTGSSVQFIDTRNEVFQYQYYRVRMAE